MTTLSSILVWRIPWTEEPGGLSMGSQRAGHDFLVTKPPPGNLPQLMFDAYLGVEGHTLWMIAHVRLVLDSHIFQARFPKLYTN